MYASVPSSASLPRSARAAWRSLSSAVPKRGRARASGLGVATTSARGSPRDPRRRDRRGQYALVSDRGRRAGLESLRRIGMRELIRLGFRRIWSSSLSSRRAWISPLTQVRKARVPHSHDAFRSRVVHRFDNGFHGFWSGLSRARQRSGSAPPGCERSMSRSTTQETPSTRSGSCAVTSGGVAPISDALFPTRRRRGSPPGAYTFVSARVRASWRTVCHSSCERRDAGDLKAYRTSMRGTFPRSEGARTWGSAGPPLSRSQGFGIRKIRRAPVDNASRAHWEGAVAPWTPAGSPREPFDHRRRCPPTHRLRREELCDEPWHARLRRLNGAVVDLAPDLIGDRDSICRASFSKSISVWRRELEPMAHAEFCLKRRRSGK